MKKALVHHHGDRGARRPAAPPSGGSTRPWPPPPARTTRAGLIHGRPRRQHGAGDGVGADEEPGQQRPGAEDGRADHQLLAPLI